MSNTIKDLIDKDLNDIKPLKDHLRTTPKEREEAFDNLIEKTPEDTAVEELNKKHAAIHTDQFYILTEKPHALFDGIDFTLESKQSFINCYENQMVKCSDKKLRSKAKIWLSHPKRREFHGIQFDPTTSEHKKGLYNIWKGFAITPKEGNCQLFKTHIKSVICNGNTEYYNYIIKWMAHLVQKPDKLSPVIVLVGEQGTGKNTLVNALGTIFGQHYFPLDNIDQFLGRFNFHLKNAVLIHGNEAMWGGNKKQLGSLKSMVTEEFSTFEGKNKDSFTTRNFRHLILSSNEDWPVHLDRDDRRFLILQVSNKHKDDPKYFDPLRAELSNGGVEAFLYELLMTDISSFNVWRLPQNLEAFEIKLRSASSTERYIYEALKIGGFDLGMTQQANKWENLKDSYLLQIVAVYADYKSWVEHQGMKAEDSPALGKAIKRLIPSTDKVRPSGKKGEPRPFFYEFPILAKARTEFQKEYKVGEEIWE